MSAKSKKKSYISEEDGAQLLERYSAKKIIMLLQEVARFPNPDIDWNDLVKTTSTGITNPREYQMVWRHLAYRDQLLDNVEDGDQPLDDDSDLESNLEALPEVSGAESVKVAACAKVLLGFGLPSDSDLPNCPKIEAPFTINIPKRNEALADSDKSQRACAQGLNIIVPVSVERGPVTQSRPKRKRPWTEEEDTKLVAAVQRRGEIWDPIVKLDFKDARTASEISQRWKNVLKKRISKLHSGATVKPQTSTKLTEAQVATRFAVSHALSMPMVDKLWAACSTGDKRISMPASSAAVPSGPEYIPPGTQTQQAMHFKGTTVPSSSAKKGPVGPHSSITETAVASGARIAPPHSSLFKMSMAGVTSLPSNNLGSQPKVHYIHTGKAPLTYSVPSPSALPPRSSRQGPAPTKPKKPQVVTHSIPPTTASSGLPVPASSSADTGLMSVEKKSGFPEVPHEQANLKESEVVGEEEDMVSEIMKQLESIDADEI